MLSQKNGRPKFELRTGQEKIFHMRHVPQDTIACNTSVGKPTLQSEDLWTSFCQLRLASPVHRAIDDPVVAKAHADWQASYLADIEAPQGTNVVAFRKAGALA